MIAQWKFPGMASVMLLVLAGCSDMMFADQQNLLPEKDPREDIVLTDVSTQMTSGGLVQQKISGNEAIFSQAQNDLTIRNIRVATIGADRATRSITQAEIGQVYFAEKPAEGIGRNDMKFAGDVLYRSPLKSDPTTDTMRLTSELIIWDESEKKFKSPQGYRMMLLPKGQAPILQYGESFEATQDLTRFVVKAGAVTTQMEGDPTAEREEMEQQFEVWREQAGGGEKPVMPKPIVVPERLM